MEGSINVPYVAFSESPKNCDHPGDLEETKSLHYAKESDPAYKIQNKKVINNLSNAQLDCVALAFQSFETILPSGCRQGFLLGDGAGVGKNLQICGVVAEYLYITDKKRSKEIHTPKVLILSCSSALFEPTKQDLKLLKVKIPLFLLGNRNEAVDIAKEHGIMFATYSLLTHMAVKKVSRYDQIVQWLGPQFDGLIVFDECHMAKRYSDLTAESTITGDRVVKLQQEFPLARILYSSATGLSTINNVGYLQRLGLYGTGTPFATSSDFIEATQNRGVSAMELLIVELRAKGVYLARTLSLKGVKFEKLQCPIHPTIYNQSTLIWALLYQYIKSDDNVAAVTISQYWQAHQRYFAALILSSKIDPLVARARLEVEKGNAVVIGLQSTGEARLRASAIKKNMNESEAFSAAKEILIEVLRKLAGIQVSFEDALKNQPSEQDLQYLREIHADQEKLIEWVENAWDFLPPVNATKKINNRNLWKNNVHESEDLKDNKKVEKNRIHVRNKYRTLMKEKIIREFHIIWPMFEENPLDVIIEKMGGSDAVAEMTGRAFKRERDDEGNYDNVSRNSHLENMKEHEEFMSGTKTTAVISEAFSTGISLHNAKNALTGRPRIHMTLEFSWSADRVYQQFGRTHRSNQREAPTYVLVVSDAPGEERFLASITEKLKLLGALTRGDKSANSVASQISVMDFDSDIWKVGITDYVSLLQKRAKRNSRDAVALQVMELLDVVSRKGLGYKVETLAKNYNKFMNRLLGMPIKIQKWILDGIISSIEDYIEALDYRDGGIKDYQLGTGVTTGLINIEEFKLTGDTSLKLHKIHIDKSMSRDTAEKLLKKYPMGEMLLSSTGPAIALPTTDRSFFVYKPFNIVKQRISPFEKRNYTVTDSKKLLLKKWKHQSRKMRQNVGMCSHQYTLGSCDYDSCNKQFKAKYELYLLCGPMSSIWDTVKETIYGKNSPRHLEATRISVDIANGVKLNLVGVVIPLYAVQSLRENLEQIHNL